MPTLTLTLLLILLSGCFSRYDYTVHRPKVLYPKPSKKALKTLLKRELGKRYRWAEEGPDAFDCSGLTYYCYGSMNRFLPRSSSEQARVGKEVSLNNLQYGDLLFFDTTRNRSNRVTHVGIYIGDGKFEHASSRSGRVKISSLNNPYYRSRLIAIRRLIEEDTNGSHAIKSQIKKDSIDSNTTSLF